MIWWFDDLISIRKYIFGFSFIHSFSQSVFRSIALPFIDDARFPLHDQYRIKAFRKSLMLAINYSTVSPWLLEYGVLCRYGMMVMILPRCPSFLIFDSRKGKDSREEGSTVGILIELATFLGSKGIPTMLCTYTTTVYPTHPSPLTTHHSGLESRCRRMYRLHPIGPIHWIHTYWRWNRLQRDAKMKAHRIEILTLDSSRRGLFNVLALITFLIHFWSSDNPTRLHTDSLPNRWCLVQSGQAGTSLFTSPEVTSTCFWHLSLLYFKRGSNKVVWEKLSHLGNG